MSTKASEGTLLAGAAKVRMAARDGLGRPSIVHVKAHHPLDDHYGLGCLGAAVVIDGRVSERSIEPGNSTLAISQRLEPLEATGERFLKDVFGNVTTWAASGRDIVFQRSNGNRRSLYRISLEGGDPQQIVTPQGASDPDWSGPMD